MEAIMIKTMNRSICRESAVRLQHTIKCPGCRRKLCDIALSADVKPIVVIHNDAIRIDYDLELLCASCKAFVGVMFG